MVYSKFLILQVYHTPAHLKPFWKEFELFSELSFPENNQKQRNKKQTSTKPNENRFVSPYTCCRIAQFAVDDKLLFIEVLCIISRKIGQAFIVGEDTLVFHTLSVLVGTLYNRPMFWLCHFFAREIWTVSIKF